MKEYSFEEAKNLGKTLTAAGLEALHQVKSTTGPVPIQVQHREIAVKMTNLLFKLAIWRKLLPDARNPHSEITTEVNLVRIGTLWLATVPGELLPALGLEIKALLIQFNAGLPDEVVAGVLGLANDELGYILPREAFRYPLNPFRPGKHYEETMSLSKEIGPKVIQAFQEIIRSLVQNSSLP